MDNSNVFKAERKKTAEKVFHGYSHTKGRVKEVESVAENLILG